MNEVLVTGAGGFIGLHLIQQLVRQGCSVRALLKPGGNRPRWNCSVSVFVGDVRDAEVMKVATKGIDTIFHLAGKVHETTAPKQDELAYDAINVGGTRNVLEGAIAEGAARFIYFSSVKAMGEEAAECRDETEAVKPETPYGKSKLAAERLVLEYGKRSPHLHVVCLRLPLVYGEGTKGNLFHMLSAIDKGYFPPLPILASRRSLVHVSNVIQAALLAATHSAAGGQVYIVTDRRTYSTTELYEMMCRQLGKRVPRWRVPVFLLKALGRVGDVIAATGRRCSFDSIAVNKLIGPAVYSSSKIARELGYSPSVSFEDALPGMLAWYRGIVV